MSYKLTVSNARTIVSLLLILHSVRGLGAITDPNDITCPAPVPINWSLEFHKCTFTAGEPYGPPNFDLPYPVAFLVPSTMPRNHSLPVVITQGGYGNNTDGPTWDGAIYDTVVIKHVADFYPTEQDHVLPNGVAPLGFGGFYFGNSNLVRHAVALDKVDQLWGDSIDHNAGVRIDGTSYGATTAEFMSVLLWEANPYWQSKITVVSSFLGAGPGFFEPGNLWDIRYDMWQAWGNGVDAENRPVNTRNAQVAKADLFQHLDRVKFIHYHFAAASNDTSVHFSVDAARRFCASGISCRAVWGEQDHALPPWSLADAWERPFDSPEQSVRLDDLALVVFQKSSANNYGPVGNINDGLRWNSAGERETENSITESIGYLRSFGLYPNEPDVVQVNVLVRLRTAKMTLKTWDIVTWSFRGASGTAISNKDGEVSVPVSIPSGPGYFDLTITKTGQRVPGC